ncbi:hypothetical protein SAMN05216361_1501 [Marisediminitalea aggregata]|uniref:AAA domain-containing protein n=1 Tax=Marisediminitalea aggregata TaxID=634436 RepID=A0A1M5HJQ0_9ALTE|nr:hypothetical protein [Marisediminitalea aggregata]SHG16193.1 hypothetical protein SAMN05216361_1501 [Marisediminitalea aggregata]
MIIKKFGFGNSKEAFILDELKENLNIIFSDDNNKGKTICLQSLFFSLGNNPIFPESFNYKEYYHYVVVKTNKKTIEIIRKENTFCTIADGAFRFFSSQAEFKLFFSENIYPLPEILHKDRIKKPDLELFHQLNFVGQDKRNTSTIFNTGFYSKSDFVNLLYSVVGIYGIEGNSDDRNKLTSEISGIKEKIKKLNKEIERLDKNSKILENVKLSMSRNSFTILEEQIEKTNKETSELTKERNKFLRQKTNNTNLIKELKSLNRNLDLGKVQCLDCGSLNINYKVRNISFDISNKGVRDSIIKSIENDTNIIIEELERVESDIEENKQKVDELLEDSTPEARDYFLFKGEVVESGKLDKEIKSLQEELRSKESILEKNKNFNIEVKEKQNSFMNSLIEEMNRIYKLVDPIGKLTFRDLFTKRNENYSGSSEQEFYFSKTLAVAKLTGHGLPIVIDSFRDRELSTEKEIKMLEIFERIDNQVIITSTLKKEEYNEAGRYQSYKDVLAIDFSQIEPFKILSQNVSGRFIEILKEFNILIDE